MLRGLMALFHTDQQHDTPEIAARNRNYQLIHEASLVAGEAVLREDPGRLAEAVRMSYRVQMEEGMNPLPIAKSVWRASTAAAVGVAMRCICSIAR